MLTLYSDRHSPFVRAILLFLKANNVDFVERKVFLFKGEQYGLPELPTKKCPTLIVDEGDHPTTLCQSTTILRYLATYHTQDHSWYTDPKIRFKIDEMFDYFQGTIQPAIFKAIQNKFFFKFFKQSEPNLALVKEGIAEWKSSMDFFYSHYLKGQTFMCGDKVCIGDVMIACSIEQMKLLIPEEEVDKLYGVYLKTVADQFKEYHLLGEVSELKTMPETLKEVGLIT